MNFKDFYMIEETEITKEMEDWFEERINKHIDLVKKYAKLIEEKYPDKFKGLSKHAEELNSRFINFVICADWMAMSEELKKNTAKEWADKNVNIRWKFTDKQKDLIYDILNNVEGKV